MKKTTGDHNFTVDHLAMIDVTWAYCRFDPREQPEEQPGEQLSDRYRNLLYELLGFSEDADDPNSPTGVWIRHNPQSFDDEAEYALEQLSIYDPIFAPYYWFLQQQERLEGWRSETSAQYTVRHITEGIEQCRLISTRAWMDHQQALLAAQMNLFSCRLYLNPERVSAKLAPKGGTSISDVPAHACIDFRFHEHQDSYWLYATLSLWTYKPKNPAFAPDYAPAETEPRFWELHILYNRYEKVLRQEFKNCVRKHFHLAEMEILGREHRSPQFWLVQNPGLPVVPKIIDDIDTDDLNKLANVLLKTPDVRSTGVAASLIDRKILTLRRFIPVSLPDDPGGLPCYIVIPLSQEAVKQEEEAWLLAQKFTDLEAFTAAQLFGVATELSIYATHLEVYKAIVVQADVFWDQLALYLPVARGRRLIRVHKLIELIHQTLLQGIAELDHAAITANEAQERTSQSAIELKDWFDRTLAERSIKEIRPICSSLIDLGYLDDAAREADNVVKQAKQVQGSCERVWLGITRAFDERRVRGTDVLEHVGFALAILVVVFSFLPEALNAIFGFWLDKPRYDRLDFLSKLTVTGIVGLILAGLWVLWRRWQLSTLGSWRFKRRHKLLHKFLANCTTGRLTRLRDTGRKGIRNILDNPPPKEERTWSKLPFGKHKTLDDSQSKEKHAWDEFFRDWDNWDRKLARQCAKVLDVLARDGDYPSSWKAPRLINLSWQVEQWALKALLVSERPREFHSFPLPRLMFLYCLYPMINGEVVLNPTKRKEPNIVSVADVRIALLNQFSDYHEQITTIESWARDQRDQINRSRFSWRRARRFVKALGKVGLKAGMTRHDFDEMLRQMRG